MSLFIQEAKNTPLRLAPGTVLILMALTVLNPHKGFGYLLSVRAGKLDRNSLRSARAAAFALLAGGAVFWVELLDTFACPVSEMGGL